MKKKQVIGLWLSLISPFCAAGSPTEPQAASTASINCQYKIDKNTTQLEPSFVSIWAKQAAIQSFQFHADHIKTELTALKPCYTEQGWKGFNEALQTSGNLAAIQNHHLVVSSQVNGEAAVKTIQETQWKVTVPLKVTYENKEKQLIQTLTVNLLIALDKQSGTLGIMQIIALPKDSADQKV